MKRIVLLRISVALAIPLSGGISDCYADKLIRLDRLVAASAADSIQQTDMPDSLRPAIDAMARIGILESSTMSGLKNMRKDGLSNSLNLR